LDQRAIMLISAFDHDTAHVLRQCAVPAETNEQKAGLHLLRQLVLTGRVVTADAAHCQQETCEQIVDSGGHYVITAKNNQPTLTSVISSEFAALDAAFSPLPSPAAAG
jgi:predicted transposase YbfD/YdcC